MKLKRVVLFGENRNGNGLGCFLEDFASLRETARVYKTHVLDPGQGNVFLVTTSKDVHLTLGRLSEESRRSFTRFVLSSLTGSGYSGLLMYESLEDNDALMVTLADDEGGNTVSIHLSPAH